MPRKKKTTDPRAAALPSGHFVHLPTADNSAVSHPEAAPKPNVNDVLDSIQRTLALSLVVTWAMENGAADELDICADAMDAVQRRLDHAWNQVSDVRDVLNANYRKLPVNTGSENDGMEVCDE